MKNFGDNYLPTCRRYFELCNYRKPLYTSEAGEDVSIWNPINPKQPYFLNFGQKNIGMIKDPFLPAVKFWDSLHFNDE